jgi:Exostosin family
VHLHVFLDLLVAGGNEGGGGGGGDPSNGQRWKKGGGRGAASAANDDGGPDRPSRLDKKANRLSALYEPWIWNSSNELSATTCDPNRTDEGGPRLNDATTLLSPCRRRPWLDDGNDGNDGNSLPKPPQVKILLTSYGWNHPNRSVGLRHGRSTRQQELLQAIVDHPLFDPHGWDEILASGGPSALVPNNHSAIRYYVFLDVETCFEANYPRYLGGDLVNADTRHNRTAPSRRKDPCVWLFSCPALQQALSTALFQASSRHSMATVVYFECRGYGQPSWYRRRRNRTSSSTMDLGGIAFDDSRVAMVALSSSSTQLDPHLDQGLAPPAVSRIVLTDNQTAAIHTCQAEAQRSLFFVFVGQVRDHSPRHDLVGLNSLTERIVSMDPTTFRTHYPQGNANYLLTHAVFAAAPRGHNLFSYRFSEVLSAGSIPVIHSDNWVLPFRKELVDWSECAVVINEADVNRTMDILRQISKERRCNMRQRCYEIYQRYMKTPSGTIDGILQGLELVAATTKRSSIDDPAKK